DNSTPLATCSPILIDKLLYFVVGEQGAGDIAGLSVATVDVSGSGKVTAVPNISLAPTQLRLNDLDQHRLPTVAADPKGNVWLCSGDPSGLVADGVTLTEDYCAGAVALGGYLYFRTYNPAADTKKDLPYASVTQLFKLAISAAAGKPTPIGNPQHTAMSSQMPVK